ncbi:MAG: class I SAM-dependent methyltransferase [Planctomycetes bacterium]|nr:class I SAM-dependent methyltransferase [Planctomycetota bacterium]
MEGIDRGCRPHSRVDPAFPRPPEAYFDRLAAFGVGNPGQRVLDLGAGQGALSIPLARRGCLVTALDSDRAALELARERAGGEGVEVEFVEAPAEDTRLAGACFDAIVCHRSWCYFDAGRAMREVARLLVPWGGVFVLSHCPWQPRHDPLAGALEDLVSRYQPRREAREGPQEGRGPLAPAGRRATGDRGRNTRTPNPDPRRPEEGAVPLPLT